MFVQWNGFDDMGSCQCGCVSATMFQYSYFYIET